MKSLDRGSIFLFVQRREQCRRMLENVQSVRVLPSEDQQEAILPADLADQAPIARSFQ